MTTHPSPKFSPRTGRRGFTLIELLVVIAIIAILAASSIPIIAMVKQSGNSMRSAANLKTIGSVFSTYASDHDNYYPQIDEGEELNFTDIELEIDEDSLEEMPYWARALIHYTADTDTDLTAGSLSCPGLKWEDSAGKKLREDDVLLAYGVTEVLLGHDADDNLSEVDPRNINRIENLARTILMVETQQDGERPIGVTEVDWSDAKQDFAKSSVEDTTTVEFRFKKAVNCLMADGSIQSIKLKNGDEVEEPNWTGLDYEDLR